KETDYVKSIVDLGGDSDAKDRNGMTPLHLAAMMNLNAAAQSLIINGADIDPRNRWGWTPLHIAAANGNVEVASVFFISNPNINSKTKDGETPLLAAFHFWKMTDFLLEKGADWKIRSSAGETPLAKAI